MLKANAELSERMALAIYNLGIRQKENDKEQRQLLANLQQK